MYYVVTVLCHYNAVAEAMNRAGLKMRLFYSHKCRCNSCSAWTGQTYSSAHCRITWPCTGIISSSLMLIKFAIASRMGWRIWPWVMSWGCPATCSAAAGCLVRVQVSIITHPAGFSHPLCSSVWSCTHPYHMGLHTLQSHGWRLLSPPLYAGQSYVTVTVLSGQQEG